MRKRADPRARRQSGGQSLVERAYREIRRRILDNEYPPAHQVLEQDLAADLGMSRTRCERRWFAFKTSTSSS
jgi:DNA-binding GntR family transcriptional regulator